MTETELKQYPLRHATQELNRAIQYIRDGRLDMAHENVIFVIERLNEWCGNAVEELCRKTADTKD